MFCHLLICIILLYVLYTGLLGWIRDQVQGPMLLWTNEEAMPVLEKDVKGLCDLEKSLEMNQQKFSLLSRWRFRWKSNEQRRGLRRITSWRSGRRRYGWGGMLMELITIIITICVLTLNIIAFKFCYAKYTCVQR